MVRAYAHKQTTRDSDELNWPYDSARICFVLPLSVLVCCVVVCVCVGVVLMDDPDAVVYLGHAWDMIYTLCSIFSSSIVRISTLSQCPRVPG